MKRGKKFQDAVKKYSKQEVYTFEDGAKLVKELAFAKFDETVDFSIRLNLKKGQSVRDTLVLPHQFKGEKKILVFAKGAKAEEAKAEEGAKSVDNSDIDEIFSIFNR